MLGKINIQKINYVLHHIKLAYDIPAQISDQFQYVDSDFNSYKKGKIYFKLSELKLDLKKIKYSANIPVLFPLTDADNLFTIENDSLIFHDDLLKSSFFLLSGYQEHNNNTKDKLGRFHFHESIQYKLGITTLPVVNYYFDIILKGINLYCEKLQIADRIEQKIIFKNFGFLLTHDIDRIKLYSLNSIFYKIKQVFGLVENPYSLRKSVCLLFSYIFNFINPSAKDPFWNFKELVEIESKNNLKSVWFFLQKNKKHIDSYYRFTDQNIRNLLKYFTAIEHEIGLHGTVQSSHDAMHQKEQLTLLSEVSEKEIIGIRQHRLIYELPITSKIQSENGLKYDSSLGFAFHEGFRNSFCLPFRPYDFENDQMIDLWEFPLNAMDSTLLDYRKLSFDEIKESLFEIISEIKKFNGLFTLLWHNHYFDEDLFPGINKFYIELLADITNQKPQNLLGSQIITKLEEFKNI
jgi:hypothetical protein